MSTRPLAPLHARARGPFEIRHEGCWRGSRVDDRSVLAVGYRMRIRLLAIICLALGLAAGAWYVRPVWTLRRLDITDPRLGAGRRCGATLRRGWCLKLDADQPLGPVRDLIVYDRITRRVTMARLIWYLPDSAAWAAAYDSAGEALATRGGHHVLCDPLPDGAAAGLEGIVRREAWRFADDEVQVLAARGRARLSEAPSPWEVDVLSVPRGESWCTLDQRRVLLPPSEWPRAARQWFEDQGLF